MAAATQRSHATRSLIAFGVIILALVGLLAGANLWSDAGLAPKLGLDLKGGTQMVLEPKLTGDQTVSPDQLAQARDIIVQRVDAGGISGAEVTTQGDRNIVVSMPEVPSQETKNALQQSSQMQFRPVLAVASGVPVPTTSPSANGSAAPGATPAPSASSSV
ncbi:MAG TPA: protein translocase subunit SecD, partial [Phycicoccus sp.]